MDPKEQIDQVVKAAADGIYSALVTPDMDEVEKALLSAYAVEQVNAELIPRLVAYRRGSVHQARQRMSVNDLAEKMGVTKARIYQILDGR